MSEVKLSIAAGKLESVEVQGRYVFVEVADGPIEVAALMSDGRNDTIILKERQQARFDTTFDKMTVRNLHTAPNAVQLMVSHAQLFPGQDGSSVTIAGQAAPLEVVQSEPIELVQSAPFEIAVPGGVLDVRLAGASLVPGVYVIGGDDVTAGTLTLNPSQAIADSGTRGQVHLKADAGNTGAVWVGAVDNGYPLEAGEAVVIGAADSLNLVAAMPGDKVHFLLVDSVV